MQPTIELRVLELICSRLCHELISPVTAINNGMELLADDPAELIDDIRDLLAGSAGEASRRLQFYRTAYGFGGQSAPALGVGDVQKLTDGLVEGGKVTIEWAVDRARQVARAEGKLLLNVLALAHEALPRGGTIRVALGDGEPLRFTVEATGQGAGLHAETAAAMAPDADVEALSARSVQGYFTKCLARQTAGELTIADQADGIISFSLAV
jgi:histidine phosphotransferase ChpT